MGAAALLERLLGLVVRTWRPCPATRRMQQGRRAGSLIVGGNASPGAADDATNGHRGPVGVFKSITSGERFYYGWVVVAVTVLALVVSAAERSAPGIHIPSLRDDLGWSRAVISFAVSIGLILYGLASPVLGAFMDRFGPRRLMIAGLLLIAASTGVGAVMQQEWCWLTRALTLPPQARRPPRR